MILHFPRIPEFDGSFWCHTGDDAQRPASRGRPVFRAGPGQEPQDPVLGPVHAGWISSVTGAPSRSGAGSARCSPGW
jgi:hypothetical protein